MKKETPAKKKSWLWITIAIVAVLAIAGGVLAFVFLNNNNQEGTDAQSSKLYWNVDRNVFMENSDNGLTTRERGEDGLYHIRMAADGELVEVLVTDARLANYIDTLDAMGLVFDADGMAIDAIDPSTFKPQVVREFYVKRVTGNTVTLNSSIAMNGLEMTYDVSQFGVYDVSPTASHPGSTAKCEVLDLVTVYGDLEGNPTDMFIIERPEDAEIYWIIPGYYDSKTKQTTRVPDENGVYTMAFYHKGETVELKTTDLALVNRIDKSSTDRSWALKVDEDGFITGTVSTQMALRGVLLTDRYHVDQWDGKTFHATGYIGKTMDKEATATLREDCEIYLVADTGVHVDHIGEKTELQLGDRILCYTDMEGKAVLIYVLNRVVESELYYNLDRSYSESKQATKRVPDEDGYYNFRMLVNGKIQMYRTKDKELANQVDAAGNCGLGMKVRGDIIEKVYGYTAVTGLTVVTSNQFITDINGTIISYAKVAAPDSPKNVVIPSDAKIYNVTKDMDGMKVGSTTTLKKYDKITIFKFLDGTFQIFVLQRYVPEAKLYYNVSPSYYAKTKETKRVPDEEGYYVIDMLCEGEEVQVKTKDKEMASYIDTATRQLPALKVNKDGVVKYAYKGNSVAKGGAFTSSSYYYDKYEEGEYKCYVINEDGTTVPNGIKIYKGEKAAQIYNVSYGYESFRGEKSTARKGDKITFVIGRMEGNVAHTGVIVERKMDLKLTFKTSQKYNSTTKETTRTTDANGYYVFDLLIDGVVKQYKTKNKELASKIDSFSTGFGVKVKGDIIEGAYNARSINGIGYAFASQFDVTSMKNGVLTLTRNRPGSSNYGEVREAPLAKDYKVYDLSPYAEKWGAKSKLKLGDRVVAYNNEEGELCAIYIMYACTRKEGPISYCDHCDKKVWWEPFLGTVFDEKEIHYYYPTDTTTSKQFTVGGVEKPAIQFRKAGVVNVYSGVELTGEIVQTHGTLNKYDTNPISAEANKMKFPDVADYEAYCPVCKKTVMWHGVSNTSRIRAAGGDHLFLRTDNTIVSENPAIYANPVEVGYESVCLHLNGKTVKANGNLLAMDGTLNIMGTGKFASSCTARGYDNAVISVHKENTVINLYGGSYVCDTKGNDVAVVLDLNGKEVTPTGCMAFVYGSLDIYDTVGGGSINIKSAEEGSGYLIANVGGRINQHTGAIKMDASSAASTTGGIVVVAEGGTYNMLGGSIENGRANNGGNIAITGGTFNLKKGTIKSGTANELGGNIYITKKGTFNMTGGKVENGTSIKRGGNVAVSSSNFNLKSGTITGGQATESGGNVYVLDAATAIMTGGTVSNGNTDGNGGNFRVQASNNVLDAEGNQIRAMLKVSGGTISGGNAANGGNISTGNHADVVHSGGQITGGTATTNGTSIMVGSTSSKLILGATITNGEVYTAQSNTVTLTGKAVIDHLKVANGKTVNLDDLQNGADIKVIADGAFTSANEKAEEYVGYFTAAGTGADSGKSFFAMDDVLYYAYPVVRAVCPVCGGEPVIWNTITDVTAMDGGHYRLAQDITKNNTDANENNFITGHGCLDLNGCDVTINAGRFLSATSGKVNIMDTKGGAVVTGSYNKSKNGAATIVIDGSSADVTLWGGTYKAMDDTFEGDADNATSLIRVRNGKLTLKDGACVDSTDYTYAGTYDAVYVGASATATTTQIFHMQGGEIKGGLYMEGTSINAISGGTVNDGVNVKTGAALVLSGAPQIPAGGLNLGTGVLLDVNGLTADAKVYVNVEFNVPFTAPYTGDVDMTQVFSTNVENLPVSKNQENQYLFILTNYYKGLAVQQKSAELKAEFLNATGNVTAVCPICGTEQTWIPIDNTFTACTAISGHYYLAYTENFNYNFTVNQNGNYLANANGALCLNLNGKTVNLGGGRFLEVSTNQPVNILDTAGAAVITGSFHRTSQYGTTLRINNDGANVSLYGGTYHGAEDTVFNTAVDNAVVAVNKGSLSMYEGVTIEGGTNAGGKGGNVIVKSATAVFNVYGGAILNGSAGDGGNIYVLETGTVNIEAGFIGGGEATNGNNIYFKTTSSKIPTFTMSGGTVVGGLTSGTNKVTAVYSGTAKVVPMAVYKDVTYVAADGVRSFINDTTRLAEGSDVWTGASMDKSYTYCPTCQAVKEWITISAPTEMVAGSHYRLKNDVNYDVAGGSFLSGAGCIDLNGKNVTITGGDFINPADVETIKVVNTVPAAN